MGGASVTRFRLAVTLIVYIAFFALSPAFAYAFSGDLSISRNTIHTANLTGILADTDEPPEDDFPDSELEEEEEPVFEWLPSMVIETELNRREEGLEMRGIIPSISEEFGEGYEDLNAIIERAIDRKIIAAKEAKARLIYFRYEVYPTDTMVSIIVLSTATSVTSTTEVFSVNFDLFTGKRLNLAEAAGPGIAPLAEKLLTEMMRRNPERYNASFDTSALGSQPFYLTDRRVVLLFNEFQLLSSAEGIKKLALELRQIATIAISREDYHILPGGYNLKMVPLKKIGNALGYRVEWNPDTYRADVFRNGELIIELEPGINNYEVIDKKIRSLEAAPEIIESIMYVPISFFDQILALVTYSVDEWEWITFLSYNE
jgi:hypothetical protein